MLGILADTATIEVFQLHDVVKLFAVDTVGGVDVTVGVGHGEHLTAQLEYLLCGVLGHIAGTGDEHGLALEVDAARLKHFHEEVHIAVTRGFGADERTAELAAFARKGSRELAGELFVHAEHVAHFTATYTNIACRHVGVGTNMAGEFKHEGLAETHYFGIALAAWREV